MVSLLERYSELVALTQIHILSEYGTVVGQRKPPLQSAVAKASAPPPAQSPSPTAKPTVAKVAIEPAVIKSMPLPSVSKETPSLDVPEKPSWLLPLPAIKEQDFSDLRKLLSGWKLRDAPLEPSHRLARTPANPLMLITASRQEPQPSLLFLHHLTMAVETEVGPCAFVFLEDLQVQGAWQKHLEAPSLLLVAMQQKDVQKDEHAKQLLNHTNASPHLGKTPLLLLPPAEVFFTDPKRKGLLWNSLSKLLRNS